MHVRHARWQARQQTRVFRPGRPSVLKNRAFPLYFSSAVSFQAFFVRTGMVTASSDTEVPVPEGTRKGKKGSYEGRRNAIASREKMHLPPA